MKSTQNPKNINRQIIVTNILITMVALLLWYGFVYYFLGDFSTSEKEIFFMGAIVALFFTLIASLFAVKKVSKVIQSDLDARDQAEATRKEFVSNVSHELKTPIALIQGYAEGLQEGIMDDENSRKIYLDVIIDEAGKMNRLVREMLVLNQLEVGQMNVDLVEFDLSEMIAEIIDNNKIYLEAQNIVYTYDGEETCLVYSDAFLTEQVLTNYISNAIHYVSNENIITITCQPVKNNRVRISVFNSGQQISDEHIARLWEKFYKADKARSREYGGSGIGLSVVKATMERLQEKYGVENQPGGVCFWFELPLAKKSRN